MDLAFQGTRVVGYFLDFINVNQLFIIRYIYFLTSSTIHAKDEMKKKLIRLDYT